MKRTYINVLWAMLLLILGVSCSEEDFGSADKNKVLSVSDMADAFSISVNQETNTVSFEFSAKECYPIWILDVGSGTQTVTKSRFTQVISEAGTYMVEMKVGNKYGISEGSITKNITLNQTLVDEAKVLALCGSLTGSKVWVWNSRVDGHFGCGPSGSSDGLGWWTCGAEEKKDWGIYDDSFTFNADGSYIYNPGEGGTIYVNKGCSKFPEYDPANDNDGGADYMAAVDVQNSTWKLSKEGDDWYMTFPAGTFMGYVPGNTAYDTPKFRIVSISETKLAMVADDGNITWRYEFIPKDIFDSGEVPDVFDEGMDLDASKYATGIVGTWTWEASTKGHFGCGEGPDNPTGWWSASPNEKSDFFIYDDVLTFTADGEYTFDPGADGKIYVNKDVMAFPEYVEGGADDYNTVVEKQTATYSLVVEDGASYLVFPANTIVSYIPSNAVYAAPKFKITRMTTTMVEFVSLDPGISWKYRFKKIG